MNLIELHSRAADAVNRYILGIRLEDWDKESNCRGWKVRDLVNHLVKENLWVTELLAGKRAETVIGGFEGDQLGNNPSKAWSDSLQAVVAAIPEKNLESTIVHLATGDVSADEYLSQRILNLTIHGWDIAKSTGQKEEIDPELVTFLYDKFAPLERQLRASGMYGERIDVDEKADLQTKLLGILGRKR